MTTARQLVKGALKLIRVLRKNEDPEAGEASDGLTALNDMLQMWSNDGLMVPSLVWENFTLTPGTATYTIGASQTFNTTRPIRIDHAYIRSGTTDYPVEIIGPEKFNGIQEKSSQGTPYYLNYDPQYPAAKIRLFPTPASADGLYIFSEKLITSFATLDTAASLPDGWENGIKHALAERLAPEYGKDISPVLAKNIAFAVGALKRTKARQVDMSYQNSPVEKTNIYSG